MSDGTYVDLIVLALIAGFILLKLRNTLGKPTDNDRPVSRILQQFEDNERIIQLPERSKETSTPKPQEEITLTDFGSEQIANGLIEIRGADASFNPKEFTEGAKMAFDMVFDAFARGNKDTLKMLLADEVYKEFEAEITKRTTQEESEHTTLVSIKSASITSARLEKHVASIAVKFITEQISVTRNKEGKVVAGDASRVHQAEDEWVFERDTRSKNPNWKIIAT